MDPLNIPGIIIAAYIVDQEANNHGKEYFIDSGHIYIDGNCVFCHAFYPNMESVR
jgi:hypothetical protein